MDEFMVTIPIRETPVVKVQVEHPITSLYIGMPIREYDGLDEWEAHQVYDFPLTREEQYRMLCIIQEKLQHYSSIVDATGNKVPNIFSQARESVLVQRFPQSIRALFDLFGWDVQFDRWDCDIMRITPQRTKCVEEDDHLLFALIAPVLDKEWGRDLHVQADDGSHLVWEFTRGECLCQLWEEPPWGCGSGSGSGSDGYSAFDIRVVPPLIAYERETVL